MYFFFSRIIYWVLYNQVAIILILIFFYLINKNKNIKFFLKRFLLAYILIIAILPTGTLLLYALENKYMHRINELNDIDGILVLSGMEKLYLIYGLIFLTIKPKAHHAIFMVNQIISIVTIQKVNV